MPLVAPPAGGALDVRLFTWVEQRPITRVCTAAHQPNAFNPSASPGRFRPFYSGGVQPVPTMYGANNISGVLGETAFHDVPAEHGDWSIPRASLYARLRTVLIPQRALQLIDLTGWAHKALKIDGRALVEAEPDDYPLTALWAERFHAAPEAPDGLYWRSRQYDSSFALLLFGDRVGGSELRVVLDETIALWQGEGLDEVLAAAERASITIVK
jgi:hypothetical protein